MLQLSIAKDFSKEPGFRFKWQSPGTSGEEFRDNVLEPKYDEALAAADKLEVSLDGTNGYLTSFLEEAFGGLQRKRSGSNVLNTISIVSEEEPHWIDDIRVYVDKVISEQDDS